MNSSQPPGQQYNDDFLLDKISPSDGTNALFAGIEPLINTEDVGATSSQMPRPDMQTILPGQVSWPCGRLTDIFPGSPGSGNVHVLEFNSTTTDDCSGTVDLSSNFEYTNNFLHPFPIPSPFHSATQIQNVLDVEKSIVERPARTQPGYPQLSYPFQQSNHQPAGGFVPESEPRGFKSILPRPQLRETPELSLSSYPGIISGVTGLEWPSNIRPTLNVASRSKKRTGHRCIQCQIQNKKCEGRTSSAPCNRCLNFTTHHRLRNSLCTKSQFIDLVEAESYFPFAAIYELLLTAESFDILKETHAIIRNNVRGNPNPSIKSPIRSDDTIAVAAIPSRIICEIRCSMIREVVTEGLATLGGDSSKEKALPSKLLSILQKFVKLAPSGRLVELQRGSQISKSAFSLALEFCMSTEFYLLEYTEQGEISINTSVNAGCIGWIAMRYLELCMFQYLQKAVNSNGKRLPEQIKAATQLVLGILAFKNDSVKIDTFTIANIGDLCLDLYDVRVAVEKQTGRRVATDSFESRMESQIEHQKQIRMALWVYGYSLATESMFDSYWRHAENRIVSLQDTTIFIHSFRTSLQAFDEYRKKRAHLFRRIITPFSYYYGALYLGLDKLAQKILFCEKGSSGWAFATFFEVMAKSLLHDLCLIISMHTVIEPSSMVASRLFLALASLHICMNIRPDDNALCMMSYIQEEVSNRRRLMKMHDLISKEAAMMGVHVQTLITIFAIQGNNGPEGLPKFPFLVGVRAGGRWKELSAMFGEAIILSGSPIRDGEMPFDIPMIVEAANDKMYEKMKAMLETKCGWLKRTCHQLNGVLERIEGLEKKGEMEQAEIHTEIQAIVSGTIGYYDANLVAMGHLRSLLPVISAGELFKNLERTYQGPPESFLVTLAVCGLTILIFLSNHVPRSKEELAIWSEQAVAKCVGQRPLANRRQVLHVARQVLDSLWVKV